MNNVKGALEDLGFPDNRGYADYYAKPSPAQGATTELASVALGNQTDKAAVLDDPRHVAFSENLLTPAA